MAKYLFERPNFTDIDSAKDYLWRLVETLEHLPDEKSTTTSNISNTTINNVELNDEIIEVGTSGAWDYRKWSSGIAECWCSYTVSPTWSEYFTAKWSTQDVIFYITGAYNVSYPTNFFNAVPKLQITAEGSSGATLWLITKSRGTSASSPECRVASASNNNTSVTFNFYATGRWQ